ncbi:HAMP domain-containing sensor histidine kinase [Thalassospira sp. GB04J01]|uniref:HAMP domain-containing sensor histidine kinase n=1 Tax=Thalassospira sp. GB04J01 TaxID=1485225 RepID=UPI000C9A87E0|nr:HAMP domain-containing sensor histidine kinase [Thalassospira sp. GB04J01]|tara:strand:+ start:41776 stop:43152 length:1377 start_codon:yes stop_codon:yes gene_type:complete
MKINKFRTLRSQFSVLLLSALAIVQCVSIWLFMEERRETNLYSLSKDSASRVLTVADKLDMSPPEIDSLILQLSSSIDFKLHLGTSPMTGSPASEALSSFHDNIEAIQNHLGIDPARKISVALFDPFLASRLDTNTQLFSKHDSEELVVSAQLQNGQWLNARVDTGGPPFRWAWPAIISLSLTTVTVFAIIYYLVGWISTPLQTLAEKTEGFSQGLTVVPTPMTGPIEVQRLSATFDEMAENVSKLIAERSTMLAALGHDLRSPITAMRLRLEMIEDAETRERIENCLNEMQALVESALSLAKGTQSNGPSEKIALHDLLEKLCSEINENSGPVFVHIKDACSVTTEPESLKRAIRNIIENAVLYGNEATVQLEVIDQNAQVSIADKGPGIPENARKEVFQAFVRLETSRSRQTGGSGLGLAIAKMTIDRFQGSIHIQSNSPHGSKFVVLLPIINELS